MEASATNERLLGYEAGKNWLEFAAELERSELAAVFAGGGFTVVVDGVVFPSLGSALEEHRSAESLEVNFSTSPWLSGFRDALIEDLGGEPG